ncbi:MAG: hypothetical protein IIA72_23230 [Proteobacteria bacterium]|nr:hypothetical protein [Pseudomonadota bacterium]
MNALSPPRPADASRDGWRHIGKIADGVVRSIGFQAIRFHLDRAAASGGREALTHFREADQIRRSLGLSWGQYVAGLDVSAREAA